MFGKYELILIVLVIYFVFIKDLDYIQNRQKYVANETQNSKILS